MRKLLALLACLFFAIPSHGSAADLSAPEIGAALGSILSAEGNPPVGATKIDKGALQAVYVARGFQPLWLDKDGALTPGATSAISLLNDAAGEGLNPQAYHVGAIEALAKPNLATEAASFDLLLSDGLALYLHDTGVGRTPVGPERDPSFPAVYDPVTTLNAVSALSPEDLKKYAAGLAPTEPAYQAARQALADFRQLQVAGGWQPLPDGPSLKPGMRDKAIPLLRQRLDVEPGIQPTLYDDQLVGAVKAFQEKHAIKNDGTLGHDTRAALNMPVEGRIAEAVATMERLRWLPHDLGSRYVMVDVAGFWVRLVENGQVRMELPVIVGREKRETPLLASEIEDAVVNPTWTVPPTIIKEDILPKLREDPGYLATKGLKLYRRGDDGLEEISAGNWHGGSEYILRQPPGEENPLGRFKLLFPNRYSIYLHDTPEQKKFTAALRNFSSGCVRVENVRQLFEALLAGQTTPEQIDSYLADGKTRTIKLQNPLPVYITYLSLWTEGQGNPIFGPNTYFGPDLYDKDAGLAAEVQAPR